MKKKMRLKNKNAQLFYLFLSNFKNCRRISVSDCRDVPPDRLALSSLSAPPLFHFETSSAPSSAASPEAPPDQTPNVSSVPKSNTHSANETPPASPAAAAEAADAPRIPPPRCEALRESDGNLRSVPDTDLRSPAIPVNPPSPFPTSPDNREAARATAASAGAAHRFHSKPLAFRLPAPAQETESAPHPHAGQSKHSALHQKKQPRLHSGPPSQKQRNFSLQPDRADETQSIHRATESNGTPAA